VYQCIRCGACLNVCPVFRLVGGHVYGHVYTGGIGAVLTACLGGMPRFREFQELCIGCRACTAVCPGRIDIPGLIAVLRTRDVAAHGRRAAGGFHFEAIVANRRVFHALLRAAADRRKEAARGPFIRHLPLFLAGLTEGRSLPAIAATPLRDRLARTPRREDGAPARTAAFFSGCAIDFVHPEIGESVSRVLGDLGIDMRFPIEQGCCGRPVFALGDVATAARMARRTIEALEDAAGDPVVAACPSCVEMLRRIYPELLEDDPEWVPRAVALAGRVREFSEFVCAEYDKAGRLSGGPAGNAALSRVTVHDSCHMKRGLGIHREPRRLLAGSGRYDIVEMTAADACCGMAGSFGIRHAELSVPILERKLAAIRASRAEVVAVGCPGCIMQIGGGLDQQAPEITVKHVADLVAEAIAG
jgi:Fe-S oxidoreductase